MKPQYSEREIEELCDLYAWRGKDVMLHNIIDFLKEKHNLSDVNAIIVDLRVEFENNRLRKMREEIEERYKDSTLDETLYKRLDYEGK